MYHIFTSALCPPTADTPAVLSTEPSMFLVRTCHIQTWEVPQDGWGWAADPQGRHGLGLIRRWLSSWVNAEAPKGESGQGISPASPLTQEIAEPLFDLKIGMEQLARNHTFKCILATLLATGNFLNGSQVRSRVRTNHGVWVPRRVCGELGGTGGDSVDLQIGSLLEQGGEFLLSPLGFRAEALSSATWRRSRK